MSLLPLLFDDSDDWDLIRPTRLQGQHFGLGISENDLLTPYLPRRVRRLAHSPYYRPWASRAAHKDEGSTVKAEKNRFQVSLDVQQFSPDEVTVKVTDDNTITVEGKHEEKEDEHGFISRHFIRKYKLPRGHDIGKAKSELSSDGILTITAPKVGTDESKHVEIPVIQTGKPSRAIKDKSKEVCENGSETMECEKPEDKPEPKRRKR